MAVVQIKGLNEVTRNLKMFGATAEDLKEANAKISSKVAGDAAAIVPVLTGKLQSTIKGNKAQRKASIKAGSAAVPYAGRVEYGYPKVNQKAQPFLQRAAWTNQWFIIEQYEDNLNEIIRKYNLQ
jgi:hypothetical protein